jgi:hypothetical protein
MKQTERPLEFRFVGCEYEAATGEARLDYAFDDGRVLSELLVFPHAPWPPDPSRQAAFQHALSLLHLIAGVSYYKAVLPERISVNTAKDGKLGDPLASFMDETYVQGLAEFAYVNGLDVASRVSFPRKSGSARTDRSLMLPERALVAMGGGKDSLVGLEMLRESGIEVMPICSGESPLIAETVAAAGFPLLQIKRIMSPRLAEMNAAGAWNGHVPVTAINSAIVLCAAILYGAKYIVFANERSADEATLVDSAGNAVNHQYSKSTAFESAFRDIINQYISADIEYFSILRPFSEFEVIRRFSGLHKYHAVFSSCNRNFHLEGSRLTGQSNTRWCGKCPKCLFAALGLGLFLEPAEVSAIQGSDLLNRESNIDGVRALCNLGEDKPFECVGEVGECRTALAELGRSRNWKNHAVVRALMPELAGLAIQPLASLLEPAPNHFIPPLIAASMGLAPGPDFVPQKESDKEER